MPNYETYYDVLRENSVRRNVFGGSVVTLLVLAAALAVASLL
ncbi:MAG TPA: hypothetical protein VMW18_20185 [Candidatus Binatia bacterium]|nr:hypothetical protein [Candidatus Binatia bacterium]